jgi:hypothetical protein
VYGSWPIVRGSPVGVLVAPNVLRFGAPSLVRVPGDGCPAADVDGVDADPAGADAAVAVGPEATAGVRSTGPD